MPYFKLENPGTITPPYAFDFHSHFNGILPLESDIVWNHNELTLKCYDKNGNIIGNSTVTIKKEQELSIIGLLIPEATWNTINTNTNEERSQKYNKAKKEAYYRLFKLALTLVEKKNPFAYKDLHTYQRGECAAENIYIACRLLLDSIGHSLAYLIDENKIYTITKKILSDQPSLLDNDAAYHIIAYFNKKIFTANKYTPFDDAYWARDAVRDDPDQSIQQKFNYMSLAYLYCSGITYAQIATSPNSIINLDKCITEFSTRPQTTFSYKLLVHSPEIYGQADEFQNALKHIQELFAEHPTDYNHLVGIDLLAAETKTGLYEDFFTFLLNNIRYFSNYVQGSNRPCRKIIIHIHCGEGSGVSNSNRSLYGHYVCNAVIPDLEKINRRLSAYATKCFYNTKSRQTHMLREKQNQASQIKDYHEISSLFDELFYWNNLTIDGLQLHRFDITSPVSQSLVAYNGKINSMHLCDALTFPCSQNNSYYNLLCEYGRNFSFRIGHAYYNRNYMVDKFPALYYDTNLGSNFITGASALFDSAQIYRLNRGLRHLDGQIDTNILEQAMNAVAYVGPDRLTNEQANYAIDDHLSLETLEKFGLIGTTAQCAVNLLASHWNSSNPANIHRRRLLLSIVTNWRSYIFGSDAQGVEHSDVMIEAIRMAIMLIYELSSVSDNTSISINLIQEFIQFFNELSLEYWKETINQNAALQNTTPQKYKIYLLDGFKSPHSVIRVKVKKETT